MESDGISITKPTSMHGLIIWNITKALEKNPAMDLKSSMRAAQKRLNDGASNAQAPSAVISQHPEEQHLQCALLAWQQLGHSHADSLYKFIETHTKEEQIKKAKMDRMKCTQHVLPNSSKCSDDFSFASYSYGPVVKLPVETKFIMRADNMCAPPSKPLPQCAPKKECGDKDMKEKLEAVCCLDSKCAERLAEMDAATAELRKRAENLARREAERVELLERAEAAWKDLETGYLRRISLAEEKEEDLKKQITKLIDERNGYKNACSDLAKQTKEKSDKAEKDKANLTSVEKELYERARTKLKLGEECKRRETEFVEQQCRVGQLERDIKFREEQLRRKLSLLEKDAESTRVISLESERAMRAELGALREQFDEVSKQLLDEDEANTGVKNEIELLRQDKMSLLKVLDGCKEICDNKRQSKLDELQKLKGQLEELKKKALECRCKVPLDVTVEAKRTPSLAAMCRCAPEDKLLKSCSCSSLRSRLISNLLATLFSGLQAELGSSGSQMPCQLLKCLDDKHNWDRASQVKNNLRDHFSRLLVGELDIAIATSIENYHAQWVGTSCADAPKIKPGPEDDQDVGWEQRAIERRAQVMATQLAEQLFQDRAEELVKQAKEIVTKGPPPCKCKSGQSKAANHAVFPVLIQSKMPVNGKSEPRQVNQISPEKSAQWQRTIRDIIQIKHEIEGLKNDLIKKEDLKLIEDKITNVIKQASMKAENENMNTIIRTTGIHEDRKVNNTKTRNVENSLEKVKCNDTSDNKKKSMDANKSPRRSIEQEISSRQSRKINHDQTYAVNLCICDQHKTYKQGHKSQINNKGKKIVKHKPLKNMIASTTSVKLTKPINLNTLHDETNEINKSLIQPDPPKKYKCFHKIPSNKSIDKLFDTLPRLKSGLEDPHDQCIRCAKSISALANWRNKVTDTGNLTSSITTTKDQAIGNEVSSDMKLKNEYLGLNKNFITDSVYMGAIYLDKSNENLHKCRNDDEYTKLEKHKDVISNLPECINTFPVLDVNQTEILNQVENNMRKPISNSTNLAHYTDKTALSTKNKVVESLKDQNNLKNEMKEENISNEFDLSQNTFENYIQFLGVTLANLYPNNTNEKSNNSNNDANHVFYSTNTDMYNKEIYEHQKTKYCINLPEENFEALHYKKGTKEEINASLDDFKSSIDIMATSLNRKNQIGLDKSVDLQSFKDSDNSLDACICCNYLNVDNSKDLEYNTFHLLENHLKDKLEELKACSCKLSCISHKEEKQIFSTILKRVKQVISNYANDLKSSSRGIVSNDVTWSRAYGLLQEYMKIKLKRVHCLCELNDTKNEILPNILEKVCNLIELDFERLKNICKCKNDNEHNKDLQPPNQNNGSKELPEKDTNNCENPYGGSDLKYSNTSNKLADPVPFQAPPYSVMKTKSCDVMYSVIKVEQATETDIILAKNKSFGVLCVNNDFNYCNLESPQENPNFLDINVSNGILMNNVYADAVMQNDGMKKPIRNLFCESLGVWGTESNNNKSKIISDVINDTIIMNNRNGVLYCNDKIEHMNRKHPETNNKQYSEVAIDVRANEEIKLKNSNENLSTIHNTTSTFEDSMYMEMNNSLSEGQIDCLRTNSTKLKNSIYSPKYILDNATANDTDLKSTTQSCCCDKVPVCHIKMLVENIENNLLECKCTCDSLITKVFPVHSKRR